MLGFVGSSYLLHRNWIGRLRIFDRRRRPTPDRGALMNITIQNKLPHGYVSRKNAAGCVGETAMFVLAMVPSVI